jgi:hypothetical protein
MCNPCARNGQYDVGIDALDDNDVVVIAGFLGIPEYWLGTIPGMSGCLTALWVFYLSKRKSFRPRRANGDATKFCEKAFN